MKFMLSLLALIAVVAASPTPSLPVNPGGIGGLFKGPNSETIIQGPDGSIITSAHEGGEVHTKLDPIVVAEPVTSVPVPVVAVEKERSSDLIGPSGRIATQGSSSVVAGPASTTVTGPAIVAETVVKGAPIISSETVSVSTGPILTASTGPILGISTITSGPIATVTGAPVASISATGAPIAAVTVAPPPVITGALPIATATPTATINGNIAAVSVSTPLPVISSTLAPPVVLGLQNHAVVDINDQIDLGGAQLINDQIAIDNRQINLNPALIPTANIIPPEIGIASKPTIIDDRLLISSTPGPEIIDRTVTSNVVPVPVTTPNIQRIGANNIRLTPDQQLALQHQQATSIIGRPEVVDRTATPGLGAFGVTPNIQRIDADNINIRLTPEEQLALQHQQATSIIGRPNVVDRTINPDLGPFRVTPNIQGIDAGNINIKLTPEQQLALQNQQAIVLNQQTTSVNSRPDTDNVNIKLTPEQHVALQNQQTILNNQQGTSIDGRLLFTPTPRTAVLQPTLTPELGVTLPASNIQRIDTDNIKLTQEQQLALQNQQAILNNQAQNSQNQQVVDIRPRQEIISDPRLANRQEIIIDQKLSQQPLGTALRNDIFLNRGVPPTLANIQQQELLSAELVKSGIDAGEIHLTNVPLSSVSAVPVNLVNSPRLNNGIPVAAGLSAYGRHLRDANKKE